MHLPLSVLRPPSSVARFLLSVHRSPSSVFCSLSTALRPPSSVLRSPLAWAFLLVFLVRVLCLVTYPPNIAGDNIGYFKMLTQGKSNLVHPPGYPFLVGLPIRIFFRLTHTAWWIDLHPVRVQYMVVVWQHMLSMAALIIGCLTVRRIFGGGVAVASLLIYGLRPRTFGAISWFFPEWFQADLLILTLCAAWFAFRAVSPTRKIALYGLSFLLLAWCYLTKYNALFFLPVLMAVVLFDPFGPGVGPVPANPMDEPELESGRPRPSISGPGSGRLQRRLRWLTLALGLGLAVGNIAVFAWTWHRASTGTAALSKDHAWVLLTAMGQWSPGKTLDPGAGPETKRLIYLNSVLPWHSGAGPFWNIEPTPEGPALRSPWREKFHHVLSADAATLSRLLAAVPPPKAPYDFFTAFFPTYLYLGADESDRLGVRVFVENVMAHPGLFLGYYFRQLGRSLWRWPSRPQFDDLPAAPAYAPAGLGLWRREQAGPTHAHTFWYTRPLVWRPGAALLHALDRIYVLPSLVVVVGIAVYLGVQLARLRHGRMDSAAGAVLVLTACGAVYMAGMHAVFFRSKEAYLVTPLAMTLFAAALCAGVAHLRGRLHPTAPSEVPAAAPVRA